LGAFSWPPGGAGGWSGAGGVCANPAIGKTPTDAMIAMNFIFMVLFDLIIVRQPE
jgi:hypothetical protein